MNLIQQAGYDKWNYERGMIRGMVYGAIMTLVAIAVASTAINWHAVCNL